MATNEFALRRTRRNMIGVSVALILIYWFGGEFPSDLQVFGYELPMSGTDIEALAWIYLVYLCIEYFVHLRGEFGQLRQVYEPRRNRLMSKVVWKNLDNKRRNQILSSAKEEARHNQFDYLHVDSVITYQGTTRVLVRPQLKTRPGFSQSRKSLDSLQVDIKSWRFLPSKTCALVFVFFADGVGYEYILPAAFPLAALVLLALHRVPHALAAFSASS